MDRLTTDLMLIQLAFLEAWISAVSHMWQSWQQILSADLELLQGPAMRRWADVLRMPQEWTEAAAEEPVPPRRRGAGVERLR